MIDADALTEELSSLTTTITGLRAGKGVLREFMTEYRKSVLRIVDEQPTIDAAPVVRCKDCKHGESSVNALGESSCCCNNPDVGFYEWLLDEDDFCSYGERKDNGTD
jgi:hypothetical protein